MADPVDGATFFAGVEELLPGTWMRVKAEGVERRRFWAFDPAAPLPTRRDDELVEFFAETLRRAVADRLRGAGRAAILLSGGLDSASVAALATDELSRRGGPPLLAVSWVFDQLEDCDERPYLDILARRLPLDARRVPGDDAWPLRDADSWPINPNTPESNPFRRLFERAYAAAHDGGARLLLHGGFGDPLYLGAARWSLDRLDPRRPLAALGDFAWHLRSQGWRDVWRRGVRRPLAERRRGLHPSSPPDWLTGEARELLPRGVWPPDLEHCRRPAQARRLLGLLAARGASVDIHHENRLGLEVCSPYRDLRVIELMLRLPPHLLYDRGLYKTVLRRALAEHLPEEILQRRRPTLLTPLFERGMREREGDTARRILAHRSATWSRWVRPEQLRELISAPTQDARRAHLVWYAAAWELWLRALERDGLRL